MLGGLLVFEAEAAPAEVAAGPLGWIVAGVIGVAIVGLAVAAAMESSNETYSRKPPSGSQSCPFEEEPPPQPPEPPPGKEPPVDVTGPIIALGLATAAGKKPVMDPNLSPADQELWKKCSQLHDTYKATQGSVADRASRIKELAERLSQNKGSPQDKLDLCLLLDEQIEEAQLLHKQRKEYTDNDCDKFDWFGEGRTEQERRAAHEGEMANVDKQIKVF